MRAKNRHNVPPSAGRNNIIVWRLVQSEKGRIAARQLLRYLMCSVPHILAVESKILRSPDHGIKNGRAGTRTQDLTDVNPVNGDHGRDVTSLEVESFNN